MRKHTTPDQRRRFHELHQQGLSYPQIAEQYGVSRECVRYWCRRQRDGGRCETSYNRKPRAILGRFEWRVRYYILRLRLQYPRWGPACIRYQLQQRPCLRGLTLPSRAQIGRYLHQWARFRRKRKRKSEGQRPNPPTRVHQRWQLDFKVSIPLRPEGAVDLHTVRDPVGEACVGAVVYLKEHPDTPTSRIPMEQARSTLRWCFDYWQTLPEEVQTDGESTLVGRPGDTFPSVFTLWLTGLGIQHLVIRPGKPTDNAEVERCHRTIHNYAIVGNEHHALAKLQSMLTDAVVDLACALPSRAPGCAGRAPIEAHPELLEPRRFFRSEQELALFDVQRVHVYLATFIWTRKVGDTGQISIGGPHEYYSVGRAYAHQDITVRFDSADRHFVFYLPSSAQDDPAQHHLQEIGRRPARGLEVEDLTGLALWPANLVPQQLPLPLVFQEG
jgi:transposase InsO family protein